MTLTANIDVVNAYMFRGIPQDESRVIMCADLGIAALRRCLRTC